MKQIIISWRKQQPVHITKLNTIILAIAIAAAAPISITSKVSADQYDAQIKVLQAEISRYQAQISGLHSQTLTLQDALDILASEKAVIQNRIELSQAKYNQLQPQIDQTARQIKINRDALGVTIADMYVENKITPIEMLASSQNIGGYLDAQEYRSSVSSQLTQIIKTINKLKAELDSQQASIDRALTDSKNAREALARKEAEQQTLLAQTKGQEALYESLAATKQAENTRLVQEQIASNMSAAQQGNSQVVVGDVLGGGGYPAAWGRAPQDTVVDNWALYNRECVSYVAWKIASTGRFVPNFNGQGNANQWESYVAKYGIKSGKKPVVGSAAVLYGGAYGHVMYVESVSSDASRITVSEYNYGWSGMYSKRSISSAGLTYLYF